MNDSAVSQAMLTPLAGMSGSRLAALFLGIYAACALPGAPWAEMSAGAQIASVVLGATLAALSAIDAKTFRLPDAVVLPLIVLGPVTAYFGGWGDPAWHLLSAVAGFASLAVIALGYKAVRGREGLGWGDVKLFSAAGAWLGAEHLPSVLLLATLIALIAVGLASVSRRHLSRETAIPFGPFLALGIWVVWMHGNLV